MSLAARETARETYQREKQTGERRPNGAKPLTKLSGKHLTCINYHLAGIKQGIIAEKMGMNPAWVSMILSDPLAQAVIQQRFLELDGELRALYPQAIEVLRAGMAPTIDVIKPTLEGDTEVVTVSTPMEVRISAADKFSRAQGHYNPKNNQSAAITAEDIVASMLAQTRQGECTTVGITVTKGDRGAPMQAPVWEQAAE